jgi:signal peptidase II
VIRAGMAVAVAVYALDRLGKWLVLEVLSLPEQPIVLAPFFNLVFVRNTGVSFGMLQNDLDLGRWLLVTFALAVIVALLIWLARTRSALLALALGMVIGGAAGNVTDRIVWGYVVDFFNFHLGGWHFPVFNVADAAIVCGFGLIVLDGLFAGRKRGI